MSLGCTFSCTKTSFKRKKQRKVHSKQTTAGPPWTSEVSLHLPRMAATREGFTSPGLQGGHTRRQQGG